MARGDGNAQRFAALTPAQRAVARPEEIEYDRGPLTVEDLRALPDSPLIVVDGAPPDPAVAAAGQAVWLPSQCQGWLAHQPGRSVRLAAQTFDCECAQPGCNAASSTPAA